MSSLPEFVGTIHIFFGPYRGNPMGLYLRKEGDSCSISPTIYPWDRFVGVGETVNKAAADFDAKWKASDLATEMYSGPHWEGGIKPEKPKPTPKPPAAAKPEAAKPETPRTESPEASDLPKTDTAAVAASPTTVGDSASPSSATTPSPDTAPSQTMPSGTDDSSPSAPQEGTNPPAVDDSTASADPSTGSPSA